MANPELDYPYDAIILLCGGVHKSKKGQYGLNFESSFKAKAAAIAYQSKIAPMIISSGGPMWGAPPLGWLMAEYLSRHRLNDKYFVSREAIIEENYSTDTTEQVKNIQAIVTEKGFERLSVIADSVHLQLVIPLFKNWGIEVDGLSMEELLLSRNPRFDRIINKLHSSLYWRWWKFKYTRLQKALVKNPTLSSPILSFITKFQRTKLPWLRLPGTT